MAVMRILVGHSGTLYTNAAAGGVVIATRDMMMIDRTLPTGLSHGNDAPIHT